jgi:S-(hydroxymethyl)glutathione dehydrogenase/alcohol dehydrogenase
VTVNLAMLTLVQKKRQGTIFGGGNPHYDIPQLLSMYRVQAQLRRHDHPAVHDGADQPELQDMLDGNNIRGVIRCTDDDR